MREDTKNIKFQQEEKFRWKTQHGHSTHAIIVKLYNHSTVDKVYAKRITASVGHASIVDRVGQPFRLGCWCWLVIEILFYHIKHCGFTGIKDNVVMASGPYTQSNKSEGLA